MADDDIKLGSAYVEFDARINDAEAKLAHFEQKAEDTANKSQQSLDKIGQSSEQTSTVVEAATEKMERSVTEVGETAEAAATRIEGANTRVETSTTKSSESVQRGFSATATKIQQEVTKQTGVITGLISSVTAAVGVFTIFYNIGKKVGEMLFESKTQAEKYRLELERLPETYRRASDAAKEYAGGSLRKIASESDDVARAIKGIEIATGLTAEEAIQAADMVSDKYSELASKQGQLVTDAMGTTRLVTLSTSQMIERFGTEQEQQLTGLVSRLRSVLEDAAQRSQSEEVTKRVTEALRNQIETARQSARETKAANASAVELIESTRDAFKPVEKDEIGDIYDELDRRIAMLVKAARGADENVRSSVVEAIQRAKDDADALVDLIESKSSKDRKKKIQDEISSIKRETLTPIQAEIQATKQRQEEVRKLLGDGIDDSEQKMLLRLLGEKIDRLNKEQTDALKELPAMIGEQFRDALDRALSDSSLVRTPATLDAMYAALNDLVLQTIRRS